MTSWPATTNASPKMSAFVSTTTTRSSRRPSTRKWKSLRTRCFLVARYASIGLERHIEGRTAVRPYNILNRHHLVPTQEPYERLLIRSEEHTSELQSRENLVCRLLLEKKKK